MAEDEDKVYHYSTKLENFSTQLCGGTQTAEGHVLKLNEAEHKELQKLLPKRGDLTQNVRLIDQKAAEAVARKYMESMRPVAATGAVTAAGTLHKDAVNNANEAPKSVVVPVPEGASLSLAQRLAAGRDQVLAAADANKSAEIAKNPETPPVLTESDLKNAGDGGQQNNT